jgi:hypothetical protein
MLYFIFLLVTFYIRQQIALGFFSMKKNQKQTFLSQRKTTLEH